MAQETYIPFLRCLRQCQRPNWMAGVGAAGEGAKGEGAMVKVAMDMVVAWVAKLDSKAGLWGRSDG